MGQRGPQRKSKTRVKWGVGFRVEPETRAYLEAWCARERISVAALMTHLVEDEHARLLLAELDTGEEDGANSAQR